MSRRFHASAPDFAEAFGAFVVAPRGGSDDVDARVREIIADVRARGFAALAELTALYDRFELTEANLLVGDDEIARAHDDCRPEDVAALELAAARIRAVHERQRPSDGHEVDVDGVEVGWRWTPLDSVGVYVPGGRASYPSSTLMNAIPARVAGVERVAMAAPTPDGAVNPLVLVAARLAGVDEIYRVGGAQAIAALAYGAGPIAPVDKIVGPGNAYVAAAKRAVFGVTGVDGVAGPSEILIIADASNDPAWIAADLLSQAEHDPAAQSVLITDDEAFADAVDAEVARQLETLPTQAVARAAWRAHGAAIIVDHLAIEAPALVDAIAPEHLQIAVDDPDAIAERVRHAGAIFLGRLTCEALGDYVSGSNHVLPTARTARFASGLSTADFMKRTSLQRVGPNGLAAIGPAAVRLARAEGLPAHAASVEARLKRDGG